MPLNSMDGKTPKQFSFSAEVKAETTGCCTFPQNALPVVQCGCPFSGGSSKGQLGCKKATQQLVSSGLKISKLSKAGIGILKMATSHLRCQEKKARVVRSSSTSSRHPSSNLCPRKKSTRDKLAALMLHGQRFSSPLRRKPHQDKLCSTKPQNCRRIVVLGAPRVGKTSILQRFLRDGFEEHYEPTSEDFHRKLYQIRGESYQIDILDASGERGFPAKRRLSILTGDIFLLVFSVDDRRSFEEVRDLHKEIVAAKTKLLKTKDHGRFPTIICANKVDLDPQDRAVSWAEVCQVLGEDCALFETSAKDRTNLDDVFEALAKRGGLPAETGPSQHRKISIRSYQALRSGRPRGRSNGTRALDAACGAEYPLARRPSFSTDLRQVLGYSSSGKLSKTIEKGKVQ